MSTKQAVVWSISGLEDRIAQLIAEGALVDLSEDDFYRQVKDEFLDQIREAGFRLAKNSFRKKISELVWTRDRLESLKDSVKYGLALEKFHEHHSFIPMSIIEQKAKEFSGVANINSAIKFESGINRLTTTEQLLAIEEVEFSRWSLSNPFSIPVKDPASFSALFVNGPHIGLSYNRLIVENPLRCAFAEAERRGDDVVFLTGGLMHIETKVAAGTALAHRARMSGYEFNPSVIDSRYREEAERIREDAPHDEMTYETLAERFLNLLSGFRKIAVRPNGAPQFSGHVFIVLGSNEEAFIEAAAYAEARYWTIVNRAKVRAERTMIQRNMKSAEEGDIDSEQRQEMQLQIDALRAKESRMTITNISPEDHQRYIGKVSAFLIAKYEEAIPNSKVIGLGTTFVQIGNEVIEINQSRKTAVSVTILDEFIKKHGARRTLDKSLPDVVLLCHPNSVNFSWAVVERAEQGNRGSTQVWQLPVALDKRFLSEQAQGILRLTSPIEKLLAHEQFEPGVVRLVYSNQSWNAELLSTDALKKYKQRGSGSNNGKYIYLFVDTDPHWGHPWKEFYYDREHERWLGAGPAVIEMMRRDGLFERGRMPIHSFHLLDDGVQGHHFATEGQPHQHVRSYADIEAEFNQLLKNARSQSNADVAKLALLKMRESALKQIRLRGEHWTQNQLAEYFERMIELNIDFFTAVLARAQQSKVRFRGVSEHTGQRNDTRDIGPITFGNGNHFENTIDAELTEGFLYAKLLRAELRHAPGARSFRDELDHLVRSPLYGNTHIGWGTVSAQNGYEWGLALRSNPSRKSGQGDPLRNMARNILERGNFSRIFEGRHTIHLSGDIHRFGAIRLTDATIVSCASGTDTDPYGERGFSPNNTGNLVVGLPVGGPDSGPIRIVTFRHDFIERYFEDPRVISWDELLPNPA